MQLWLLLVKHKYNSDCNIQLRLLWQSVLLSVCAFIWTRSRRINEKRKKTPKKRITFGFPTRSALTNIKRNVRHWHLTDFCPNCFVRTFSNLGEKLIESRNVNDINGFFLSIFFVIKRKSSLFVGIKIIVQFKWPQSAQTIWPLNIIVWFWLVVAISCVAAV